MSDDVTRAVSVKAANRREFWWLERSDGDSRLTVLPDGSGRAEFEAAVGGWEYATETAKTARGYDIPDTFAVVRSDTGFPFKGSVGRVWAPVSLADLYDVAERLEPFGAKLRTALELGNGNRVVLLLATPDVNFHVERRNGTVAESFPYFTLSTGVGVKSVGGGTVVDILCANTFAMAWRADGETWFGERHTPGSNERIALSAERMIADYREEISRHSEIMRALADCPMDRQGWTEFASAVALGESDPEAVAAEVARREKAQTEADSKGSSDRGFTRLAKRVEALTELYHRGDGLLGGDCYDALGAVTQWIDRGRTVEGSRKQSVGARIGVGTPDARSLWAASFGGDAASDSYAGVGNVESALFGSDADLKRLALDMLLRRAAPELAIAAG